MQIIDKPVWESSKSKEKFSQLQNDIEVDLAIIGAGITGISCAYLLAKSGLKIAVLEKKDNICEDTTMYTTAFITKDIDTPLTELIRIFGKRKARMVWESGQAAVDKIDEIVRVEKIDCDFKRCDYSIYANDPKKLEALKNEEQASEQLGFETFLHEKNDFGFVNNGALTLKDQAKFNPLKYVNALANIVKNNGVEIYVNTEVKEITGRKNLVLKTEHGNVSARKIIDATYVPLKNFKTFAKKGMYTSYVIAGNLNKGTIKEGLYIDQENPYHYLRIDAGESKDNFILGGEDHREEIKMDPEKNFQALKDYLNKILPEKNYEITNQWTGPILEPSDGLALIGASKPNIFVATGFSGNGMTYSTISAMVLKDLVQGKHNPWAEVYDPSRHMKVKALLLKAKDYSGELIGGAVKNLVKHRH